VVRFGGAIDLALATPARDYRPLTATRAPGPQEDRRVRPDTALVDQPGSLAYARESASGTGTFLFSSGGAGGRPDWGTFFVGLGIVAGEVLHVARLLDRGEVKLRRALQHTKGVWDTSAPALRVLIALTISLGVMASVYGAYHVFSLASFIR
jgi:hypothetical protein